MAHAVGPSRIAQPYERFVRLQDLLYPEDARLVDFDFRAFYPRMIFGFCSFMVLVFNFLDF